MNNSCRLWFLKKYGQSEISVKAVETFSNHSYGNDRRKKKK